MHMHRVTSLFFLPTFHHLMHLLVLEDSPQAIIIDHLIHLSSISASLSLVQRTMFEMQELPTQAVRVISFF